MDNYYQTQIFDIKTLNAMELKNLVKSLESAERVDEKELHHVLRKNSEPTESTKKPSLKCTRCCCDKVRIFSSNIAAELYPGLLGVYEVLDKEDLQSPTYKYKSIQSLTILTLPNFQIA